MRPLAISVQMVMDCNRRLCAEIEVVFEDGETILKKLPANTRLTLHFDELRQEAEDARKVG